MNHNETPPPPQYPHARAARRLRARPSGLKGRYRALRDGPPARR